MAAAYQVINSQQSHLVSRDCILVLKALRNAYDDSNARRQVLSRKADRPREESGLLYVIQKTDIQCLITSGKAAHSKQRGLHGS